MRSRTPYYIFTITLVSVYWCVSVVLSPFPYWVAKFVPASVDRTMDAMMGDGVCSCGMEMDCGMSCCDGKENMSNGIMPPAQQNGDHEPRSLMLGSHGDSGAGCGCILQVPPADIPVEYVPVFGKHYYYPWQHGISLPVVDGLAGGVACEVFSLTSLCEIGPPSPPPKLSI